MAEMTDAQFKQKVIDILDEVGAALNREGDIDVISSLEEWNRLAAAITLPGIEMEQAEVKRYVAAPLSYFAQYCEAEAARERAAWLAWFGVAPSGEDPGTGVQGEWSVLKKEAEDAIASVEGVVENIEEVVQAAETATSAANTAAQAADASRQQIEQNEATRQSNEQTREGQEQTRQTQESARVTAEGNRATAEQGRATAEQNRATAEQNRASAEQGRVTQASSDHTRAEGDHTRAEQDHQAAETATAGAEKVNAELDGMKVIITNRQGTSSSVDLSFDFYNTYSSVAAMNADRANIPVSALVSIATDDPTSAENARVYQKRSDGQMKYLFDLDQASAEAWAEWLNTKKPQIDAAITQAVQDHTRAEGDHTTAQSDHTQAGQDHTRAEGDHTTAGTDHITAGNDHTQAGQDHNRAENIANHPPYIADGTPEKPGDVGFYYQWDYATQRYVKDIRISLDWSTMSDAEKEALVAEILASIAFDDTPTADSNKAVRSSGIYTALQGKQDTLTFASDQTCEDIIDELT